MRLEAVKKRMLGLRSTLHCGDLLSCLSSLFVGSSPQALSKQLANDVRTWAKWVKDAGVRAE
jgi:hypothetical protein